MKNICKAVRFAFEAHKGQVRKNSDTPYIFHPVRVAEMVSNIKGSTEEMIISAYLHDTIEDCEITKEQIKNEFGETVSEYVDWLTNKSKSLNISPRQARKEYDFKRLASAPKEVKIIKLCDRIDNLHDMETLNKKFKLLYLQESELLYESIKDGDKNLSSELNKIINDKRTKL